MTDQGRQGVPFGRFSKRSARRRGTDARPWPGCSPTSSPLAQPRSGVRSTGRASRAFPDASQRATSVQRPLVACERLGSPQATALSTTRPISSRNSRLRVFFVNRFSPRLACFMPQMLVVRAVLGNACRPGVLQTFPNRFVKGTSCGKPPLTSNARQFRNGQVAVASARSIAAHAFLADRPLPVNH